jgi:hypothetical protein
MFSAVLAEIYVEVVVCLFIGTQKKVSGPPLYPKEAHEETDIPTAQCNLSTCYDKAVRNDLSLNTRVIRSVVPANDLINDIYKERKKAPRVRELSRDI